MKVLIRSLAAVAGIALLAFIALAVYLSLLFDPNDYRDRLAAEVRARTGRELLISGEIALGFFPRVGLELGRASLGNAPGFGEQPFARIESADVQVALMPLLREEIEIERVILKGLALNLERDPGGRSNWADLVSPGAPSAPGGPGAGAGSGAAALAIGVLEVDGAQLLWNDRQAGVRHEVRNLGLKTGPVRAGESFPLALGFDLASAEPAFEGRFDLDGQLLAEPAAGRLTAERLAARLALTGSGLPGGALEAELSARLELDAAADTLAVEELRVIAYGLEASGALSGRGLAAEPGFTGTLAIAPFDPRELLKALGQTLAPGADPSALKRASVSASLDAAPGRLMWTGLDARLDDSVLTGSLGVSDTATGALRFDLVLDGIDLDRYLPPRPAGGPAPAATPGAAAAAAAGEPTALRALDVQGRLRVGQLRAAGLRLSDLDVNARAAGGVLRVQPVKAALYGGRYSGNITVDARGKAPRVSLDESLGGVQIGPLLRDLGGKEEKFTGRADIRARLQATGAELEAVRRSLGGSVEFRLSDGAVKGVNVAHFLREAEARLRGQPVPAASGPNQTDFSELSGSLRVADGIARNEDLAAKSPLLRVSGSGSFDLVRERIDYLVRASVVGTLTGQGGKELERLRGVTVPIKVSGSFDAPGYALDVERLLADNVKGEARQRVEQEIEKVLPGLKDLFR